MCSPFFQVRSELWKEEVNVLTVTSESTPLNYQPCVFGLDPITISFENKPAQRTESKKIYNR